MVIKDKSMQLTMPTELKVFITNFLTFNLNYQIITLKYNHYYGSGWITFQQSNIRALTNIKILNNIKTKTACNFALSPIWFESELLFILGSRITIFLCQNRF